MSCQFRPTKYAVELDVLDGAPSYSVVSKPTEMEGVAVPVLSGLHQPLKPTDEKLPLPPVP